jgi:hypothetical protein
MGVKLQKLAIPDTALLRQPQRLNRLVPVWCGRARKFRSLLLAVVTKEVQLPRVEYSFDLVQGSGAFLSSLR